MADDMEIAIVGVGCKLPGANNLDEYWRVLKNGENRVVDIPRDRWNSDAYFDPDPRTPMKTNVTRAGLVDGVYMWDPAFYGISDKEALLIDPQQRMVLDCVQMALDDGGITKDDVSGTETGVYIGVCNDDYKGLVYDTPNPYAATGIHNSIVSARVSYLYNVLGPSMSIDTACSSSLVAVDLGIQAIMTGSCTAAICGGVNALLDPRMFVTLAKTRMLSPDGQCKAFSKDADGFGRGEGCGIVILKRLDEAVRDGNKIWGTIKTFTNQDGKTVTPMVAPSGFQQYKLLETIYKRYEVDKYDVQVVEAHGTGTAIGDPTEINALGVFFGDKPGKKTYVGSVKSNIGHLESAAGIAALIKVLLMIRNKCIVPSIHYSKEKENPKLNLEDYGFIIPTSCIEWNNNKGKPRIASLNSFSFGGTNAHAIVSEYVENKKDPAEGSNGICPIITLSAADFITLVENAKTLKQILETSKQDISQLSISSLKKNKHLQKRKAFASESKEDIIRSCATFIKERTEQKWLNDAKNVVFVFCGVGTVWKGMCTWLLKNQVFSKTLDDIDKHLHKLTGWKIKEKLATRDQQIQADPMGAHIAIFACQVGLFEVWKSFGIHPDKVVGQSVGEVAAAFASGAIDLTTAVNIVYYRSKFLANMSSGSMAVVLHVNVDEVKRFCGGQKNLYIAVFNSPVSCTVSGLAADIEHLREKFSRNGGKVILLDVPCAYHSPFVEQASKELGLALGKISSGNSHTTMISTVTGKAVSVAEIADSKYWEKNVLYPVLFSEAIRASRQASSHTVFVEIGPSPVLKAHISDIFGTEKETVTVIPSVRRDDESRSFLQAVCDMYESGLALEWNNIIPSKSNNRRQIQQSKFNKVKVGIETENNLEVLQGLLASHHTRHPYVKAFKHNRDCFEFTADIEPKTAPFVYSNRFKDAIMLTKSIYADIGLHVGTSVYGVPKEKLILSLDFLRAVTVETGVRTSLEVETSDDGGEMLLDISHNKAVTCRGWISKTDITKMNTAKRYNIEEIAIGIKMKPHERLSQADYREVFGSIGMVYEDAHRLIKRCVYNSKEALLDIEIPQDLQENCFTSFNPNLFDCMLHATVINTLEHQKQQGILQTEWDSVFPTAVSGIRCWRQLEARMHIFSKRINRIVLETGDQLHYSVQLMDFVGNKIAEIENVTICLPKTKEKQPIQVSYKQLWVPTSDIIPVMEERRKLVIAKGFSNLDIREMNWDTSVNLLSCSHTDTNAESIIENALNIKRILALEQLDAIVFIVKGTLDESEVTEISSHKIYNATSATCMFVIDLIRYLVKKRQKTPLYLVTEATQQVPNENQTALNFVGSELWGLTRAAHTDFVYGGLTSIDLWPSLKETKEKLLEFVSSTCKKIDDTSTDYAIDQDTIYKFQIRKTPKFHQIPGVKTVMTSVSTGNTDHKVVCYSGALVQENLFLVPKETQDAVNGHETVMLKTTSVAVPPLFIQSSGVPAIGIKEDNSKPMCDGDQPLFTVEFTGYQIKGSDTYENGTCWTFTTERDFDTHADQEYVVLYPATICTEMRVPKSVVVRKLDLPFYEPGLLLYCALFWKHLEFVPKNATVGIFCNYRDDKRSTLLKSMLTSLRRATVVDISTINCESKADVCIAIDDISNGLSLLSKCSRIICTQTQISTQVRKAITLTEKELVEIKPEDVFTGSYLRKHVSHVVTWLKNNGQALSKLKKSLEFETQNAFDTLPCRSISISSEKGPTQFRMKLSPTQLFHKSASYLVTGGLTGLGWETTKILAEMGAGTVVTFARSAVTAETWEKIHTLENQTECKIIPLKADVSNITQLRLSIAELKSKKLPPVRGVFHLAGAIDTNPLMTITQEQIEKVLKPKVLGTMNLHVICNEMNIRLDYFVASSSINAVLGSPGQSNYGAANSFMDSFISWRRTQGLEGQSINWGALNLGFALMNNFISNFEKRGLTPLTIPEIRACHVAELMETSSGTVYTNFDWEVASQIFTVQSLKRVGMMYSSLFKQVLSSKKTVETLDLKFDVNSLRKCNAEQQKEALTRVFRFIASKALNTDIDRIRTDQSLVEMGFDSLSAVSAINLIHEMTNYRMPVEFLWNPSTTLQGIINHVQEHVF